MKKSTKIIVFGVFAYFLLNSKKDETVNTPPFNPYPPVNDNPPVTIKYPNSQVRNSRPNKVIML